MTKKYVLDPATRKLVEHQFVLSPFLAPNVIPDQAGKLRRGTRMERSLTPKELAG